MLLVEDEATNQQYVKIIVEKIGMELDIADSGKEAISLAGSNSYRLVLMDINLGKDMNGVEAMNEIRKDKYYKDVPFIAITANAMQGHEQEFLNKGFDAYLSKPFNADQIRKMISELINNSDK